VDDAKKRAQHFDAQTALDRKTNEALALAKAQAHLRGDEENETDGQTPLVDCAYGSSFRERDT
jgi:chromatin-remodeling ATPase INO80